MFRVVEFRKWEIVREWYCRTEEKAKEIVRTLIQKDYKLNFDVYDEIFEEEDWTLEEFIEVKADYIINKPMEIVDIVMGEKND